MRFLLSPHYDAHDAFLTAARAKPEVWRLLLGVVVIVVAYFGLSQIYFSLILATMSNTSAERFLEDIATGRTQAGLYTLLFQFLVVWIAVGLACLVMHRRGWLSVLGPLRPALIQFGRVLLALLTWGVVIFVLPPWGQQVGYVPAMELGLWLSLLPLTALAVLVQSGAEEVLFRGYLQQQLAVRFRSPIIWMGIPSALFAFGHYMPDSAGSNAWMIVIWAGIFGLLMADITARAGTLGPALAIHFANNISALALTSLPDQMSGLALYHMPFGMDDEAALAAWMPVDFVFMIVMWLTARVVLRR